MDKMVISKGKNIYPGQKNSREYWIGMNWCRQKSKPRRSRVGQNSEGTKPYAYADDKYAIFAAGSPHHLSNLILLYPPRGTLVVIFCTRFSFSPKSEIARIWIFLFIYIKSRGKWKWRSASISWTRCNRTPTFCFY